MLKTKDKGKVCLKKQIGGNMMHLIVTENEFVREAVDPCVLKEDSVRFAEWWNVSTESNSIKTFSFLGNFHPINKIFLFRSSLPFFYIFRWIS